MAVVGTGSSITFASGFLAEIISIEGAFNRAAVDSTHMGTTGARDYIPGSLVDASWEVEIAFAPQTTPPWASAEESITVTLTSAGTGGNSTWVATGFLTDFSVSVPLEERQTARASLQLTAIPAVTP